MERAFTRVAIVNRGEPAMRFIHAIREYNGEHNTDIQTIALYTDPDENTLFVKEADEAFRIGAATFTDESGGVKSAYLNDERIAEILKESGAQAVWPGWGFVAEKTDFVDLCERLGIIFIGPDAQVMRKLGDKITSKQIAETAGVPVIPWSGGAIKTVAEAKKIAKKIGYPLMLKATAGGGGRGIRKVESEKMLVNAFKRASVESASAFGDPTVFLEKLIAPVRHVEVQIIGDHKGNVWSLGVRDCTIQRKHQKILEESPSPALSAETQEQLCQAAVRIGAAVGYQNAGTVEFLYDLTNDRFAFMELNARLQVEHPVTEMISDVDLVKLQIHVARGGELPGGPPTLRGHAIEVRLNAENPANQFAPSPGKIERFQIPAGPGIRVDTGYTEGDEIPPDFDSMIAKIIAYGRTREEALSRLRRAMAQSSIIIRNGMSNKSFLLRLLHQPAVASAQLDTGWLEELVKKKEHIARKYAEVALLQAAVEVCLAEMEVERAKFYNAAHRGRPEVNEKNGVKVNLVFHGEPYKFKVFRLGNHDFRVDVDGKRIYLKSTPTGRWEWRVEIGDKKYRVYSLTEGQPFQVEVNGYVHQIHQDQGGVVRSPAPAVVVTTNVTVGDTVKTGDVLAVLEAMKMEMTINASFPGTVKKVMARDNMQVYNGAPLMLIEPADVDLQTPESFERIEFDEILPPPLDSGKKHRYCRQNARAIRRILLGFDVEPADLKQAVEDRAGLCLTLPPDDAELLAREREILNIFVDIIALFRREPTPEEFDKGVRLSSEEYFFTYLQNVRAEDEALPASFIKKLLRALSHYGLESLDPSPTLDVSLFRICISHRRMARQIAPVLSILERRLQYADALKTVVGDDFRTLLNRIIIETQRRFPEIYDMARQAHYLYFDKPLLDKVRRESLHRVTQYLDQLAKNPEQAERDALIEALVTCPQPIKPLLSNRFVSADKEMQQMILEVITRRYYRIRKLKNLTFRGFNSTNILSTNYDFKGTRIHVYATHARFEKLAEVTNALNTLLQTIPPDQDVSFDLYFWHGDKAAAREDFAEKIIDALNKADFSHPLRRVVASISGPDISEGMSGVNLFTFRQSETGFYEDKVLHGIHPLMAARLEVWRLNNFDIERLPSIEDIYLFKATAKSDPRDQRLFAFAEVRDLTTFHSADGALQYPNMELMLQESMASIRRFHSRTLNWNRILLYIWPPLLIDPDDFRQMINRLAPVTEGVGLEKVMLRAKTARWPGKDPGQSNGDLKDTVIEISRPAGHDLLIRYREPAFRPIRSLSEYDKKVVRLRRRNLVYPYELIRMLTLGEKGDHKNLPSGEFIEYDLDEKNQLVPVERRYGLNTANIVVGVIRNFTEKYPEGMSRVALFGDPGKAMGSVAEPECRRINAGMELARQMNVPLEWYAVSAGAKIAMDSGTENMDWISLTLRRIVEFTQAGGELNVIVNGINVGAQPYWNAEATMLMHTRGILIMTPESAMVLTGKQALEYSGGVAAEDNQGIGGYERIMGPNGQAQYFARDIGEACQVLMRYYDHSYATPGERFPRAAKITDPVDRDVRKYPYHGEFTRVGDIFSDKTNPGRKHSFDIRQVMQATIDQDFPPLERWFGMQNAEIAVVWDAHVGGIPVCMLGMESKPIPRLGYAPADGPEFWTSGTLFPLSSKKIARAINAASGNRPLVVLANLSGFDGSPESLRKWQLEFGAEIGRSIVNFRGPIVFCVISRYHGGAFVVFSNKLNDNMVVIAVEGTYASVIGGAPAAAVVFAREVKKRTLADARIVELNEQISAADGVPRVKLRSRYNALYPEVYSQKLGEVAKEFDGIHSVQRAQKVGSVDVIIPPGQLRPYIIETLKRGMAREMERIAEKTKDEG